MKPEAAIGLLKKHVLYRASKSKNREYTKALEDAVNSLIDLYNEHEELREQLVDAKSECETVRGMMMEQKQISEQLVKIVDRQAATEIGIIYSSYTLEAIYRKRAAKTTDPEDPVFEMIEQQRQTRSEGVERLNRRLLLFYNNRLTEEDILRIRETLKGIITF